MNGGVYQNDKYTAYFTAKNIIICTGLQCFRISYTDRRHSSLLDELTIAIMRGRVKDLSELKTFNGVLKWENCSKPYLSQLDLPL